MVESPRHSVSVAGIVLNSAGQILVIQRRDNGQWQPPGGVLELGESIDAGVRREILEETGIRVTVGPITGVYKNTKLAVVALVLRCSEPLGHARASSETSQVLWMRPQEAIERMSDVFAIRVKDAMSTVDGAAQRTHDGSDLLDTGPS